MESFIYDRTSRPRQQLLVSEVRSATNQTEITIRYPADTSVVFVFDDVPDAGNRVTPRFLTERGVPFLEGEPVEAPAVVQAYLIGHGQIVPSGIIAKITGMLEGVGEGQDQMVDLDVEAFDQFKAQGITGHFPFTLPKFILEMVHDGAAPITYGATITVGDIGS